MLAGDFEAVAIGAWNDGCAPAFGIARNIRHLVNDAIAQDQAARPKAFAIASEDGEVVDGAGNAVGTGIDHSDRRIALQLLPRLGQDVQRWLVIVAEHTVRAAREAITRQAGIENGDLTAGTAELQGGGETGKAAADDDDVIHSSGLRIVGRRCWIRTRDGLGVRKADGGQRGQLQQCSSLHGTLMFFDSFFGLHISETKWYRNSRIKILSRTGIDMTENSRGRRGRPANEALGQTIVDAASELFAELGFQATTLDKVAQRAKISKLSIYRHFESKEALFGAAFAARCHQLIPQVLFEGVDGSAEDQLMAVGSSLLRTLLRPDVRNVEAMVMADTTNQKSLGKLHYDAGPAHIIAQIEVLLRQLHDKAVLNVPDPLRSARLFAALFKGSDLLIIARFDQARAEDDKEIESYCRSAVAMFMAAHGGND